MTISRLSRVRARVLGALAVLAVAAVLVPAAPARAALSGTDWTEVSLPANYYFTGEQSPVSCVPGTRFCVALVFDSNNLVNGGHLGQDALVSTDAGKSWTGYTTLPATLQLTGLSCVSASVCWADGTDVTGKPGVAETTNGGQTWTNMTPASWTSATWWPNSLDCVSATTCWLVGQDEPQGLVNPSVVETTDGGTTWTVFSNLPAITATDPNGTYDLNGISCLSATSCVAVGGLNYPDGTATVISTADGGATWTLSTDPTLSRLQQLFGVSCLPTAAGVTRCIAAGAALAAAGPVTLVSPDGGTSWGQKQKFDNTGWFNSISCASAHRCWAAGGGTSVALAGTVTGGTSWSTVTSDTTNEDGSVACLTNQICVATTDGGIWVTRNDGGL